MSWGDEDVERRIDAAGRRVRSVLAEARDGDRPPHDVAQESVRAPGCVIARAFG